MQEIAIDTETYLMGPCNVAPKLICVSAAWEENGEIETFLLGNGDAELYPFIREILDGDYKICFHNAAFDLSVFATNYPNLIPIIFKALDDGRVSDTKILEKLILLATTGNLENIELPNGIKKKIKLSLSALEEKYLFVNRSEQKTSEDSWRFNFDKLDGWKAENYPVEAKDYALSDAVGTLGVRKKQLELAKEHDINLLVEEFQVAVDFCLRLVTAWGWKIDLQKKQKIEEETKKELSPERLNLLIESGILRPGHNGRPKLKNPNELTKPEPESIDQKKLRELVLKVCTENQIEIKYTNPSIRFPDGQISLSAEFIEDLIHLNPILEQYHHRASLLRIISTELPRMSGEIIHPEYDVLKETGRTSSYASDLYPSSAIQQIDPRVRECYIARPGYVLFSIDYSALELVTSANKYYELFGESNLRDKLLLGIDPHAYLGAQLAYHLSDEFRLACDEIGASSDADKIYDIFLQLKSGDEESQKFYSHYRTFAKPTGLGYPGGLGPDTFCKFAKATYGIKVDRETADKLREIWKETYPEVRWYFNWVNEYCIDPTNLDVNGENKYQYKTPMGMLRRGCTYCAACNGAALQSPAAEGAKLAVWNVVRACYDQTLNSPLFETTRILAFIHDEIIGETLYDRDSGKRACIVKDIMIESMAKIIVNVPVKCEAKLMRYWSKAAKPIYDNDGNLLIWEG